MGHIVNNGDIVVVEGLGKRSLENGSGGGSVNPPKFKKRRLSAVRDFPKGCGRFAAVIGNGVVVQSVEEDIRRRGVVDEQESCSANNSVEPKTLEMAAGLVEKESPLSPNSLINETAMPLENLVQAEDLEPVKSSEPKTLEMTASLVEKESPLLPNSSINQTAMPLENLVQAEDLEPVKSSEQMMVDALPLQSVPPDNVVEGLDKLQMVVTVGTVPGKMRKICLPRRSVSACRDFPPGCGRNAAPLNSKELQELVKASKGESLVNKKKDMIVKTDPKNLKAEVQVADSSKSETNEEITKKIGEGAQMKAEVGIKDTVEQIHVSDLSKSASKQEHMNEIIIKTPLESVMSKSDSRPPSFSKKVCKGSGGSEDKLGMESVKLNEDTSSQSKLPVNSVNDRCVVNQTQGREYAGLGATEDRVIVQALMAEPNCPWSQAKKTSHPATANQSQVGQAKKTPKSASGKQSQLEQGKKTVKSASGNQSQHQMVKYVGLQTSDNREIVQSLMAAPNCPWRQGLKQASKGKKQAFVRK